MNANDGANATARGEQAAAEPGRGVADDGDRVHDRARA